MEHKRWNSFFFLTVILILGIFITCFYYLSSGPAWHDAPQNSLEAKALSNETSESYEQPEVTQPDTAVNSPEPTQVANEVTPSAQNSSCTGVGQSVQANGLEFTIRKALLLDENGKDLVILDFLIEDLSNERESLYPGSFDAFVDDFAVNYEFPSSLGPYRDQYLNATLTPGKKAEGVVGYILKRGWEKLELQYLYWSGDGQAKISFCITPKDFK